MFALMGWRRLQKCCSCIQTSIEMTVVQMTHFLLTLSATHPMPSNRSTVPQVDILTMGLPCVDLSGLKNCPDLIFGRGASGQTATGFSSLRRYVRQRRPPIVLMENSDRMYHRLANSNGLPPIDTIEKFAIDEGYIVAHGVGNAAEFGLPQNRPRCYMMWVLGSQCAVQEPEPIKACFEGFKTKPLSLQSIRMREDSFFGASGRSAEPDKRRQGDRWRKDYDQEVQKLGKAHFS